MPVINIKFPDPWKDLLTDPSQRYMLNFISLPGRPQILIIQFIFRMVLLYGWYDITYLQKGLEMKFIPSEEN